MMKMTKPVMLVAAALFTMGSASLQAGDRSFADVYAECGIGAMLFSKNDDTNRTLAIISNVTWDLGTTAHSSNITTEDSCKGGQVATAALIMQSYPNIESDLAKGNGEYLTAMIETMGCTDPRAEIISGLRSDMAQAVSSTDYSSKSRREKSEMLYDALSARCTT